MNIQEFGIFITDRNVVKLESTTIRYYNKFHNICNNKGKTKKKNNTYEFPQN